jgi:hypothetical protein
MAETSLLIARVEITTYSFCPQGTYKSFEFRPDGFRLLPDYDVLVCVYGLMSIKWWLPDVIE